MSKFVWRHLWTTPYLLYEFVRELAAGSKLLDLERHVLLGLRVEGRIDDQTIDEQPQVISNLKKNITF